MVKKALIIGHTGQDGYYLTNHLESLGYGVFGVSSSSFYNLEDVTLPDGGVTMESFCDALIDKLIPDEVYYLAALHQSSIEKNVDDLKFYKDTIEVNAFGLLNMLSSLSKYSPSCKVFYASSSHIFADTSSITQDESTPTCPISIYGVSKVLGMQFCDLYRKKNIFCSVGIFYNHESPRRQSKFVSKKIVETAVAIFRGQKNELILGNLQARVDWGYAPDYIQAAHKILQLTSSGPKIISSGTMHSIEDFIVRVFGLLNL